MVEVNTSPTFKEIKDCAHLVSTNTRISSSVEQASESMDSDRKNGSTLAFIKGHEADMQSSLVKSEISTEMEMRKTTMHDSQHTTESSCSNSLPVVVPVSCSNQSYQDSSNSNESGVSAQIATKAVRNETARNGNRSSSMINNEAASLEDAQVLNKVMKGKDMEEFWVIESADSSTTKRGKKTMEDEEKVAAGFDLNEDINANETTDFASVSSHSVIYVVAKAGIPFGQPLKPLKFEGRLGWNGTSETSAFRPTRFTGIDLNVSVVEEDISSNSETSRKRAKIPWIDLNDEAIPPKPESSPLVDLNLDYPNSRMGHFSLRSNNVYMASPHILESMESTKTVVPSHTSPPQSFSTKGPFLSGTYYQEHGILLEPRKPGQFLHEQRSKLEAKTEDFLATSGIKPRKFPFLSRDFQKGETVYQEDWNAALLKRKEAEGRRQKGHQFG